MGDTFGTWIPTVPDQRFAAGSYAKTDNWKEGSKVLFLDGKGQGMVSTVAKNKPNEYMSFKHLGEVKDVKKIRPAIK